MGLNKVSINSKIITKKPNKILNKRVNKNNKTITIPEKLNLTSLEELSGKLVKKNGNVYFIKNVIQMNEDNSIFTVTINNNNDKEYVLKLADSMSSDLFLNQHFLARIQKKIPENVNILPLIEKNLFIRINEKPYRNLVFEKKKNCYKYLDMRYVFEKHIDTRSCFDIYPKSVFNRFCTNILKCLEFIESVGYTYGDIKPDNLLYDDDIGDPYLIDFGIVTKLRKKKNIFYKNPVGRVDFMSIGATECMAISKNDVESFGYMLYMILEKRALPWTNDNILIAKNKKINLIKKRRTLLTNYTLIKYFDIVEKTELYQKPDYRALYKLFN